MNIDYDLSPPEGRPALAIDATSSGDEPGTVIMRREVWEIPCDCPPQQRTHPSDTCGWQHWEHRGDPIATVVI